MLVGMRMLYNFFSLYPVSYNPSRLGTSYLTSEIVIWEFPFPKFPKLSWFEVDLHSHILSLLYTHTLLPSICIDLFRVYSSSSDSHIGTYLHVLIVMLWCNVKSGQVRYKYLTVDIPSNPTPDF